MRLLLALAAMLPGMPGVPACAQSSSSTLLERARGLEVRGRTEMAVLTWQQVLLVDAANAEALAGLARVAEQGGHAEEAAGYLERLRAAHPEDPNLTHINGSGTHESQRVHLEEAAGLAAAGQYRQAMERYRAVFGSAPPLGDWALAYYETEAGIEGERSQAITGLRALAESNPSSVRYQIALARALTYGEKTRAEGRRLLERYPRDTSAVEALRQSLVWDAQNPAAAPSLRAFLILHPDPQLAQALKGRPAVSHGKRVPAASVRTSEEETAYRDLNTGHIGEAERLFQDILGRHPASAPALAGMGYVRMQQGNFGGAISFLTAARQDGIQDAELDAALDTARFWYTMGEGQTALAQNDLATAEKQYQVALAMRPQSPEALDGLGSTLLKARRPEPAIPLYERFAQAQPGAAAAWRGLLQAHLAAGDAAAALATDHTIPLTTHAMLMRDPGFVQGLASAYLATAQEAEARRVLETALNLPFPAGGQGLDADTLLQYARLLELAGHSEQAEGLYRQVLLTGTANASAWEGLIRVQHDRHEDAQAVRSLDAMPPAAYAAATREPGFDATVAAIFQAQGRPEAAQSLLEQVVAQRTAAGEAVPEVVEVQLAGVLLQRGRPELAIARFRRILVEHPDDLEAWKGLLAGLHAQGHDREALHEIQRLAPDLRMRLEAQMDYLSAVASLYKALGQPLEASVFLERVIEMSTLRQSAPPASVEIENAWLLLEGKDEVGLYAQLAALDRRVELTEEQRRMVQTIWTTWAIRRAQQAGHAGDGRGAIALLDAAVAAFPDNSTAMVLLGEGYTEAGKPNLAVALYRQQDMSHASVEIYRAAITAALAAADRRTAETWLRLALAAHPLDPQILLLGAKVEEARGSAKRAGELYRASLAAMPSGASPTASDRSLVAAPDRAVRTAIEPAGLAALLAPESASRSHSAAVGEIIHEDRLPEAAPAATPGAPPRLRDYVPAAESGHPSAAMPRGEDGLQLRNASTSLNGELARPTGRGTAKGDVLYGPYIPYVSRVAGAFDAMGPQAADSSRRGQSRPPEDDPLMPSLANDGLVPPSGQIARPAQPLGMRGQHGDSFGQQYPRPRRSPAPLSRGRTKTASRPRPPAILEPVPAPAAVMSSPGSPVVLSSVPVAARPSLPGMSYPVVGPLQPQKFGGSLPLRSDREEAEVRLASLNATYSGTVAAASLATYRTGSPGLDRLADVELPVEFSAVLARNVRAAIIPRPVFLNSGTLAASESAASVMLGTQPANLGTPQQTASGLGGEAQLVTANYGAAVGYTPYEFLVPNLLVRFRINPAGGPLTLLAERRPVTQTQLSYAGLRDPASGSVWGGVVSSGATLSLNRGSMDRGNARPAFSLAAQGVYLTGRHVLDNTMYRGSAAAQFPIKTWPRVGTLGLGGTVYASRFAHNERGLSLGLGGYFSPNYFVQAAAPVTFSGRSRESLHFRLSAAGGMQAYQERAAPFYPLDAALQATALRACSAASIAGRTCGFYAPTDGLSAHYAVDATGAYRVAEHWYFGAAVSANNSNLYQQVTTGFFLRYLFTPQLSLDGSSTGIFQTDGLLPLRIP